MANEQHLKILKQGADVWNRWRKENPNEWPDLIEASLREVDLREADLQSVDLINADLINADLRRADLSYSNLHVADFSGADLRGADLSGSILSGVDFRWADLGEADLSEATAGGTVFGDLDLREVKGLETIRHAGPSTIGIDTIYRSRGQIPEAFLRGCGVPDNFIAYHGVLDRQSLRILLLLYQPFAPR